MTSTVDTSSANLDIVCDILSKYLPPGFRVWVFGSRAKHTTTHASDLDLAVEGTRPLDRGILTDLGIAFDDSDLPYTVDVIDLKSVGINFKKIIDREKILLMDYSCKSGVDKPDRI